MKAAPFHYRAPADLAEACDLLAEYGAQARPLAGGQSLVPLMAQRTVRPRMLVDLNTVAGLDGVHATVDTVAVGAMARQHAVARSTEVRRRLPLLAAAIELIGHPQVRHRGTVGGSLAHAHPAAELPAVAVALDASLEVLRAPGERRTIAARDFFAGLMTTALRPGEVLTEVRFRVPPAGAGWAIQEITRRARDFAMLGAVAVVRCDRDGRCRAARVALFGMGEVSYRVTRAEQVLLYRPLDQTVIAAAAETVREAVSELGGPPSDVHAGSGHRGRAVVPLVERVLTEAAHRAMPTMSTDR